jgi:CRISPR-associated protein Cas2
MNKGVRERVWNIMKEWHAAEPRGSIVMIWRESEGVGSLGLAYLGTPAKMLIEMDGMWVARTGNLS